MSARRVLSAALAVLTFGCGEVYEEAVCPDTGTELTYETFGKKFLDRHCNGCHSKGAHDRRGAPEGITFDDLEEVHEWADHIYDRSAGENDSMPPGPDDPPLEEREALAEWLACGAP